MRHDFALGLPILTTKKVFLKGILGELIWFLKGTDDPAFLIENNIHIWDEWMVDTPDGKRLPHTYGVKWRNFYGVDQIRDVINLINTDPYSRRMVVSAWDPPNVKNAALPWCHVLFQFSAFPDKEPNPDGKKGGLSLAMYQRSADLFLGVPFNIASYSLLLYMIAEVTNYRPRDIHFTFGDCHVYENHIDQCKLQLTRKPYPFPELKINHKDKIDDFEFNDFELINYQHHPSIKGQVAI
jgi:thymidylate synthase